MKLPRFRPSLSLVASLALCLASSQRSAAGETPADPFDGIDLHGSVGEVGPAADAGDHFHHHHFGLFTGYARKDDSKRKEGFKTGLEYEYQFIDWLGVRGFVDYEAGDLKKWLYGAGASIHVPTTDLVLFVGGGAERKGSHSEAFLRLSAEYQFHVSDALYLSPTVGYDFVNERDGAWFAGVMFGVSF